MTDQDEELTQAKALLTNASLSAGGQPLDPERLRRLEAEAAFARALLKLIPEGVFFKDVNGRFVCVNEPFGRAAGASSLDITGKLIEDVFDRQRAEFLRAEDAEIIARGKAPPERLESHKAPDGSETLVAVTKAPVLAPDGTVLGIAGLHRRLPGTQSNDDNLRALLGKARCILWTARVKKVERDFRWQIEVVSSQLSRSELGLGVEGHDLWTGLVSAEELARMRETARSALRRNAGGYEHDFSIRGVDSLPRNFREVVRLIPLNTHEWELIGVAMDVTEQEQAEKELQRSLSIVSATIESTEDGVLVVSNTGKIIFFNTRFAEMWGIPEHIILSCDDSQALEYAAGLLEDPGDFKMKVEEAYSRPDAIYYDVLKFKDGRVFERHSHPQRVHSDATGRVWVFRDISKRARMEEQLAAANARLIKMVKEDPLSGLLNRRSVLEVAELEWSRWQRTRKPFSVLLIDIDDFKKINDLHGHLNGDHALKAVADAIRESGRALDATGRYGGEEFIVILPETPLEGAAIVAEKILAHIRRIKLACGSHALQLTASIGVAAACADDKDIDALINRADLAMYCAKRGGKNAISVRSECQETPAFGADI